MHSALLLVITVLAGSVAASKGTLNNEHLAEISSKIRETRMETPRFAHSNAPSNAPSNVPSNVPSSELRKTWAGAPSLAHKNTPSNAPSSELLAKFRDELKEKRMGMPMPMPSDAPSSEIRETRMKTPSNAPHAAPSNTPNNERREKRMLATNSELKGKRTRKVRTPLSDEPDNEPDKELFTQLSSELRKTRGGAPNDPLYQEEVRNLDPKHLNGLTFVEIADLIRTHWSAKIDWTQVSIKDIFTNSESLNSKVDPKYARATAIVLRTAGFGPRHKDKLFDLNGIELVPFRMLLLTQLLTFRCTLMKYVTINPLKLVLAIWGKTTMTASEEDDAIEKLFNCLQYDIRENPLVIDDSNASDDAALARLIKIRASPDAFKIPISLHPSVVLRAMAIVDEKYQDMVPHLLLEGASMEKPSVVSVLLQPAATVAKGLAKYVTDPASYGCFVGKAADDLKAFLESPDSQSMKHEHRQTQLDWLAKCKTLHAKVG